MTKIPNIHPGEILLEEFMEPLGITGYRLAKDLHVPATRIDSIIKGKRRLTADTACRLAQYFNISARFWLNLQLAYDLREVTRLKCNDIKKIVRCNKIPSHEETE